MSLLLQETPVDPDAIRTSFRLLEVPAPWIVVLVLLPAVFGVCWLGYRKERLRPGIRMTLSSLRALSLMLMLVVMFRPVRVKHQENIKPAEVVFLIDDSASMSRKDAYGGDPSISTDLRAASGLDPRAATRLELARKVVERELLPKLKERGYQHRFYRFSESLAPLASLDLEGGGRGRATHLGDALVSAVRAQRGRHVTDVVIVTDGRSNGGTNPLDAAGHAKAAGIPVHGLVVGDSRRERNLVIELVEFPTAVLEGDEVAVIARVHATGFESSDQTSVLLEELGDHTDDTARLVADERVDPTRSGERIVLVAPPSSAGIDSLERRFRLSVPPARGETLLDDNQVEFSVRVTPEKIRVLYIDAYPRWEYRFLNRLLKRADDRISVQCYLMSASAKFLHESSRDLPSLRELPTDRKTLLDNYDVVILGDVNPYGVSADPRIGEEFVASLQEFVERGGGLCMIAGEYDNPKAIAGTEFAKLLPVQLDSTGAVAFEGDPTQEFRPVLENPLAPHEIVRLHEDLNLNRKLWEDRDGLSGFYWYAPVVDAKPGAQVLLRHPHDSSRSGERNPILVVGYYPSGRTMYLGVDSTWRWRKRYVDRYHERFWRNAVRWLALGRLKGGDRRFNLEPLRASYGLDERVVLEARILDEDYRPSEESSQATSIQGPDGTPTEIDLLAVDGRLGLFRGSFEARRPGLHRAWIERGGRRVATTEVEVALPSRENADPSPDPDTVAGLAVIAGGVSYPLSQAAALVDEFPGGEERREAISSQLEDTWDNWAVLLGALMLLSAEWVLRKRYELI
ncbi:MAG: hypothetical protein ACI841_000861 [Planctomycetota bacterium]|jgi:hypothetical protein